MNVIVLHKPKILIDFLLDSDINLLCKLCFHCIKQNVKKNCRYVCSNIMKKVIKLSFKIKSFFVVPTT